MVISDPPRTFDLEIGHADSSTERLRQRLLEEEAKVGDTFTTEVGEPGIIVNAATAHALEVGLAELRRRRQRKQRAARASRRRNR